MTEYAIVQALMERLGNATEPTREGIEVGRLLVICSKCDRWHYTGYRQDYGCDKQDYLDWIEQLITPGRCCPVTQKGPEQLRVTRGPSC